MSKLLSAAFVRLRKDKIIWLGMIFMFVTNVYMLSVNYIDMKEEGYALTLEDFFFRYGFFILILLAVFCSLFVGTEYSDGDLQIVLSEDGSILFSNHASGLDEIETGKLFDRFYTVETAKKSTGLGLSITKILTERMGGSIIADYVEGRLNIRIFFSEDKNV